MGKKRKASSQGHSISKQESKPESSKLAINSYEDVADSEDEFLINRDRIALDEGPDAKRRRKAIENEQLLELSDEEVLAYPSSDDDEEEEGDYDEDISDAEEGDEELDTLPITLKKPKRGARPTEEFSEDEGVEGWGDSKQDYYGGDVIDTEQAALEEEAEAKRLQQKQLEAMADTDLYFDVEDAASADGEDDDDNIVTEVLPELEIPENLSSEERLKLLKSRYPEFEPIAKDWLELHGLYEVAAREAKLAKELLERKRVPGVFGGSESHIAIIRYTALSAYLGACAMYFAVLTSTANGTSGTLALAPRKLRDHPVIGNILETRQMWQDVKDYFVPDIAAELEALEEEAKTIAASAAEPQELPGKKLKGDRPKKAKKSKAERQAEAVEAASAARRAERMRKVEEDLADLLALTKKQSKRSSMAKVASSGKLIINEEDSDFGDETELNAEDLAAKAQRKKSLKFYTSQIAQKANKRGTAGRDTGGDADIPHRERLKDRAARLNAEAEKRGKKALQPGEELDGADSDDDAVRKGELASQEDYYDMVAARSKQKKADSKAAAEAYSQAKKQGAMVHEVAEIGPDGKRKISYQIEKNKGLTPHRKKEVRNPRVKKKIKYAEKMKKLGSTKQVYKGGEGKGGYGGELSGIKTALIKSVKL